MKLYPFPFICLALVGVSQAYDIDLITHDTKLWSKSLVQVKEQFPEVKWYLEGTSRLVGTHSALTFNGQAISSTELIVGKDGFIDELVINVFNQGQPKPLSEKDFKGQALNWKRSLDKILGSSGQPLPLISEGDTKTNRIAWTGSHSNVHLYASVTDVPQNLSISISAKGAKLKTTGSLTSPKTTTGTQQKVAVDTTHDQLKGITSYYESGKFEKRDITKTPEQYLLYFSASW